MQYDAFRDALFQLPVFDTHTHMNMPAVPVAAQSVWDIGHYFEALPANRCALVATDARCIEWCYTKTLLVKQILAQFLRDQIRKGWINAEDALWVAHWWLHDTAARHYVG